MFPAGQKMKARAFEETCSLNLSWLEHFLRELYTTFLLEIKMSTNVTSKAYLHKTAMCFKKLPQNPNSTHFGDVALVLAFDSFWILWNFGESLGENVSLWGLFRWIVAFVCFVRVAPGFIYKVAAIQRDCCAGSGRVKIKSGCHTYLSEAANNDCNRSRLHCRQWWWRRKLAGVDIFGNQTAGLPNSLGWLGLGVLGPSPKSELRMRTKMRMMEEQAAQGLTSLATSDQAPAAKYGCCCWSLPTFWGWWAATM